MVGQSFTRHDHRGRPYVVQLTWSVVERTLTVTSVTITAGDGGGIDTSMIRSLPFKTLADQDRPAQVRLWEEHLARTDLSEAERRRVRKVLTAARAPADDPELLEVVATTYRQAYAQGVPPTKTVHEELGRRGHHLSRQQVGKLVMRCREVGLLGPAEQRKAGERPRRKKGAAK